jgi:DNA-directed RNA polymerase subunit H (RpoH/RPB5)
MEGSTFKHVLMQSRGTILDILEDRGYNSKPFRKTVGPDLLKIASSSSALRMNLTSKTDPNKFAIVQYEIDRSIKNIVGSMKFVDSLINGNAAATDNTDEMLKVDPETTEVIVIFNEREVSDDKESPFDKCSYEAWNKYKLKIQFFPIVRLVCNPLKHSLQPKFEIVPKEDHEALKKEWYITNNSQFPVIRFHADMAARCLGLMPSDIVKITSYSPTGGEYVKYRICKMSG